MAFEEFRGKQAFSGADIMVLLSVPFSAPAFREKLDKPYKVSAEIQTLTISSTTSVLPVRRVGEARPKAYTKGARTFAGSMVFTIMDSDPFKDIFAIDALSNSMSSDDSWHIDQMPPFDITIVMNNETGGMAVQMIHNARIVNWGTTYSVDDMYSEYTYSYVAEHVTPLLTSIQEQQDNLIVGNVRGRSVILTPDELIYGTKTNTSNWGTFSFDTFQNLVPKSVWVQASNETNSSPNIPDSITLGNNGQ